MIKQNFTFNDILEKKFKILRTSIMLGSLKDKEETLKEYEETARLVDKIKQDVYEEILASKKYTTTTLQDEETRLQELIDFIENRIQERNSFVDDYIKITSNYLDDLEKINEESDLSEYRSRYNNIQEYLSNCDQISRLQGELSKLKEELEEKYEYKANNELINSKLEDELIEEFNKIIARNEYYSNLDYSDIDNELDKLAVVLSEKKEVLNTFTSSYEALTNAGVSGAEREEYLSYVQDVRIDYYSELEKKYFLNIYKIVLEKEGDYNRLFTKRELIENILKERNNVRHELEISKRDDLEYYSSLCDEQFNIIKSQKFNLDNIDELIVKISNCENELNRFENDNNREEIKDLLNEFSIPKHEIEQVDLSIEDDHIDEEKTIDSDFNSLSIKPNMVVSIKNPEKINVKIASDAAKLVMKKVVIVLEPKRFNIKKDKLKEAELELEKERLEKANKTNNVSEVVPTQEVGIELSKSDIFTDDDENEIKNNAISEIKINVPESSNIIVPAEIFIEEPPKMKEEKKDLFSETDPFLDDNQFEVTSSSDVFEDETFSKMPTINNIGTVKPNNALSKIADVVNENNDIILPTLGLADNGKESVPIVSENYIS